MSANTRLLFAINGLLGRSRALDLFGLIGARWAIVIMVAWYAYVIWYQHYFFSHNTQAAWLATKATGIVWLIAWAMSIGIGLIARRPRPFIIHPQLKKLFKPLTTWKSFPSDHALGAWLLVFWALIIELPHLWTFVILALWVSWGRVYAAMHYPGDVAGGFALAALVVAGVKFVAYYM